MTAVTQKHVTAKKVDGFDLANWAKVKSLICLIIIFNPLYYGGVMHVDVIYMSFPLLQYLFIYWSRLRALHRHIKRWCKRET